MLMASHIPHVSSSSSSECTACQGVRFTDMAFLVVHAVKMSPNAERNGTPFVQRRTPWRTITWPSNFNIIVEGVDVELGRTSKLLTAAYRLSMSWEKSPKRFVVVFCYLPSTFIAHVWRPKWTMKYYRLHNGLASSYDHSAFSPSSTKSSRLKARKPVASANRFANASVGDTAEDQDLLSLVASKF
jgi:hypothetical protein